MGEREARLQAVLDHSPFLIWLKDIEGRYVLVNRRFETVFHLDRQSLQGKTDAEIFPSAQADAFRANDLKVLEADAPLEFEEIALHDDGPHTSIVMKFPLRDAQGKTCAIGGFATDITRRKRAEARFLDLLASAPDAMVIINQSGRIVLVNAQTERLFGYSREELIGQGVECLLPERYRVAHVGHRRGYFSEPHTRPMGAGLELYGCSKDGREFPVEISLSPLKTEEGISAISAIRDITDRKRVEEALKQSEERTRLILDHAYDAFVAMDGQGVITAWNTQAERIFGWPRAEAVGRLVADTILPPRFREAHLRGLQRFIDTGEGTILNKRIEMTALRRDGTEFPIEFSVTPLKHGNSYSFNAFIADITERQRVLDRLQQSHAQLRDLAARLEVVREEERARMAHEIHDELGQALTSLKLDIAWVKRQVGEASPALLEKLDAASKLTDATIQTVRNIATKLRPVVLDQLGLLPAIEWLVGEFRSRTGIPCKLNLHLRQVRMDQDRSTAVFRIVQELLTNIARHAGASRVTVTARESAGRLMIEVMDNGRGITEAELADPKAIGLIGMRQRASLFDGETTITGTPGQGTTVTVAMPFIDPDRK